MKAFFSNNKKTVMILIAAFFLCIAVFLIFTVAIPKQGPEAQARQTLSSLFTCTQQDNAALLAAITSSQSAALTDYVTARYPNLFTAEGCEAGLNNRIFAKAPAAATEFGADFAVTSVTLSRRKSEADLWYFDYEVVAEAAAPSQATLQAQGGISMAQDNGQWKAQGVAIEAFSVNG